MNTDNIVGFSLGFATGLFTGVALTCTFFYLYKKNGEQQPNATDHLLEAGQALDDEWEISH